MVHGALCTRDKLRRWGIGDGKCPFCSKQETIVHIFWECKIYKVLDWVFRVTDRLLGNVTFDSNLFIYGVSSQRLDAIVWARVWFLFAITKKLLWGRRCSAIFDKESISEDRLLLKVKEEIRLRLVIDLKRWSRDKFEKVWVKGKTFVSIVGEGDIRLNLP